MDSRANDWQGIVALLDDEEDDLEAAADQMRDLGVSAALNLLLNFGALKAGAFVVRKLGSLGTLARLNVNIINGRLAEHYIANAQGLIRNSGRLIPGTHRMPDIFGSIFGKVKILHEVKNLKNLSWSRLSDQLTAYALFARQEGMDVVIHVRSGTRVDPEVVRNLNRLLGPAWKIVRDVPEALRAAY